MDYLAKMRKARESRLALGSVMVTIRPPQQLEMANGISFDSVEGAVRHMAQYVVDWEGITELDLVPGGTDKAVPFDEALFMEWISDEPDHWSTLIEGVREAMEARIKKKDDLAGN